MLASPPEAPPEASLEAPPDVSRPSGRRAIPVERMLAAYCRERAMRFIVDDQPVPGILLLTPEGVLPLLALQAEALACALMEPAGPQGNDLVDEVIRRAQAAQASLWLGTTIHDDPGGLFGVFAAVPPLTGDGRASLRAALFIHSLHRLFGFGPGQVNVSSILSRHDHEHSGNNQSLHSILRELIRPSSESFPWQAKATP